MKKIGEKMVAILFGTASAALAAEGASSAGLSPMVVGFLAFFALIIAFQAIPGLTMLIGVVRGLVASLKRGKVPAAGVDRDDGTL
jgi:hypothetical protein